MIKGELRDPHQRWGLWLLLGLGAYFSLHMIIRATGSATLELDEAEQIVLTQWWLAGYSGQPPLYAWVQASVFQILGMNLWALSFVKNALLFLTSVFLFLSARRLSGDIRIAVLITLSLFLIPQIAWESQRDLTHSVMVTTLASAFLYAMLRWIERPHFWHYLLLGLLFGLGVLAKYNFLVFAAAAVFVLLSFARGRSVLLNPRILWSAGTALMVILPHALWFWQSRDLGAQSLGKLEYGAGLWPWSGLGSLILAVLGFLAPWLIVMGAIFRMDFLRALVKRPGVREDFPIHRYIWVVLGLLVLMALVGVSHFKDRWMQPLLFTFPLFIFALMDRSALTPGRVRAFLMVCVLVPLIVLVMMTARVQTWPVPEAQEHRHFYPFDERVREIRALGFTQGLIVGDSGFVAGNLRFRFPESQAVIPGVNPAGLRCLPGDDLLVAWDATRQRQMPGWLQSWLITELGFSPWQQTPHWLASSTGRGWSLGVLVLPGALVEDCGLSP